MRPPCAITQHYRCHIIATENPVDKTKRGEKRALPNSIKCKFIKKFNIGSRPPYDRIYVWIGFIVGQKGTYWRLELRSGPYTLKVFKFDIVRCGVGMLCAWFDIDFI